MHSPRVRWARTGSEGFRAEVDNIEPSTARVPACLLHIVLVFCATPARACSRSADSRRCCADRLLGSSQTKQSRTVLSPLSTLSPRRRLWRHLVGKSHADRLLAVCYQPQSTISQS
jgi:hypothetical protein